MTARPLAEVLLDLEQCKRDWEVAIQLDDGGVKSGALDDLQYKLRDEFRSRFRDLTGVSWSNVDAAIVSGAL